MAYLGEKFHGFVLMWAASVSWVKEVWNFLYLGGGFKYFLFSTLLGEMIQFD